MTTTGSAHYQHRQHLTSKSFSWGLNPINKKLKIDEHNTTPKLDFYFNIPETTVNTLFSEKLKVKVNYVESEEQVVSLIKEDWTI